MTPELLAHLTPKQQTLPDKRFNFSLADLQRENAELRTKLKTAEKSRDKALSDLDAKCDQYAAASQCVFQLEKQNEKWRDSAEDAETALAELATTSSALVSALNTCHVCAGEVCLDTTEPTHCEDCSADCECHEEDECVPIYVLVDKVSAAIRAAREKEQMSVQLQACQAEKAKLRAENALKLACVIDERDALQTKLEGLTVDEDWTKDDHVAMVNDANAVLQARLVEAEADAEALRALAAMALTADVQLDVTHHEGKWYCVVISEDSLAAADGSSGATLAAAIMDAMAKVGK